MKKKKHNLRETLRSIAILGLSYHFLHAVKSVLYEGDFKSLIFLPLWIVFFIPDIAEHNKTKNARQKINNILLSNAQHQLPDSAVEIYKLFEEANSFSLYELIKKDHPQVAEKIMEFKKGSITEPDLMTFLDEYDKARQA